MSYLRKWAVFVNERFNPVSYFFVILTFLGAHYVLYKKFEQINKLFQLQDLVDLVPLFLAVFLFFFKLRLFDEVKDLEFDTAHHPKRPLPRGILTKGDVLSIVYVILLLEILLFGSYGLWAFASSLIAIGYSLLMYKEFFTKRLRSHLTTYAVMHTFVVFFISLTVFVSLFKVSVVALPIELIHFSFAGWFLFNIFEFGRKTYLPSEEQKGVASYSKVFGKFGAVILILAMAATGIYFMDKTSILAGSSVPLFGFALMGVLGWMYVITNQPHIAKVYRLSTLLYIPFTYSIVMMLNLI
jgi:hypothetical protein